METSGWNFFFYYNITYGSRTPLMKERRVMHMYNIERERAFWILNRDRQITEMLVKSRNLQFPSKFALLIGPLMLLLLLKLVQLWRSIGFQSIILALCGNSFLDNTHSFISPSLVKTIVRFNVLFTGNRSMELPKPYLPCRMFFALPNAKIYSR